MLPYHIHAAVFLYLWNGLTVKTDENIILFHAFDYYYSEIWHMDRSEDLGQVVKQGKRRIKDAEEYADRFLSTYDNNQNKFPPTLRSDIVNHHEYISYTLNKNEQEANRLKIVLNIYVTFMAYQMAVYFRICVLYYSTVEPNARSIINYSQELFEYMEWFFNLLLEEKVEGYCNIGEYAFNDEFDHNVRQGKTEFICQILKTLNLNFLKNAEDVSKIRDLNQHTKNVYNVTLLPEDKKNFGSLFPSNTVTLPDTSSAPPTKKKIYNHICDTITNTYTENFKILYKYIRSVSTGKNCKITIHSEELLPIFTFHEAIRERLDKFIDIKNLMPNIRRRTFFGYGDEILRSNGVEMLRYMYEFQEGLHYYVKYRITTKNNFDMESSGKPKVVLKYASRGTGTDYIMDYSNNS